MCLCITNFVLIPDKADRKRNRVYSDDDDYNPEQEAKKRRKGDYKEEEDEDEGEEDSDYEGEVAPKVRHRAPVFIGVERTRDVFSVIHLPFAI